LQRRSTRERMPLVECPLQVHLCFFGRPDLIERHFDPRRAKPGEINHPLGGRGLYFDDPNGHLMEIITHSYGDRPEQI
jgi:hypothetical protein